MRGENPVNIKYEEENPKLSRNEISTTDLLKTALARRSRTFTKYSHVLNIILHGRMHQ